MSDFVPYLITFILGTAVGAAGGYWSARFTDQRRAQEERRREDDQFRETVEVMPDLLREMKADLASAENATFREFLVLPRNVVMNLDRDTLIYMDDGANRYLQKAEILEARGYIADIAIGRAAKFRFEEHFVKALRKWNPA